MDLRRRRYINRLPAPIRRAATAAWSANASVDDLSNLWTLMPGLLPSEFPLLLPIFCLHLDPVRIPTLNELEMHPSHFAGTSNAISAHTALYCILVNIPVELGPQLWPGVWKWSEFVTIHRAYLHEFDVPSHEDAIVDLLLFAAFFRKDESTFKLMCETPGFRCMLAGAWSLIPDMVNNDMKRDTAFKDLCIFLLLLKPTRVDLPEFIDGAGGTPDDLAVLVLHSLEFVISPHQRCVSDDQVLYIRAFVTFISGSDDGAKDDTAPFGPLYAALLLREGFIEILATLMQDVAGVDSDDSGPALFQSYSIIGRILTSSLGYKSLPVALFSGFLTAIVLSATHRMSAALHSVLRCFLRIVLRPHVVYYHALSELRNALSRVEHLTSTADFQNSQIFGEWEEFRDMVQDRLPLLTQFDSDEHLSLKACDNLECGKISDKSHFKRCAGCWTCYYCSRACQTRDWRDGGHQIACEDYRVYGLNDSQDLDARERSFMRALLHHDYEKSRPAIYAKLLTFISQHPSTDYVTVFNYCAGRPSIRVKSAQEFSALLSDGASTALARDISRASGSGARMDVHVMHVSNGESDVYWAVPCRMNDPETNKQLQRSVQSIPPDYAQQDSPYLPEIVRSLLACQSADAVEIH